MEWLVKANGVVEISVSHLSPATNYTLLVYAENASGRSASAFLVYPTTGGENSQLLYKIRLSYIANLDPDAQGMDSPAACASCAMPTADEYNHSAAGTTHLHRTASAT